MNEDLCCAMPVRATDAYVMFDHQTDFRECLRTCMDVRGTALDLAEFAYEMFGPLARGARSKKGGPLRDTKETLDSSRSLRRRPTSVFVPMCFVMAPSFPLYVLSPSKKKEEARSPRHSTKKAAGSNDQNKRAMQKGKDITVPEFNNTTGDDEFLTLYDESFLEGQLRVATSSGRSVDALLVPPSQVDKQLRCPEGSARAFNAAALRILQLAHMFQRPEKVHVIQADEPKEVDFMFEAFFQAIRVISTSVGEKRARSRSDKAYLGDILDKAVHLNIESGRIARHRPSAQCTNGLIRMGVIAGANPYLASALECACYLAGSEELPVASEPAGAVVRASAAVLGLESFRSEGPRRSEENRSEIPDADQVQRLAQSALEHLIPEPNAEADEGRGLSSSDRCPVRAFRFTQRMLRDWTSRNGRGTSDAKSAPAVLVPIQLALKRMDLLRREALRLAPSRSQRGIAGSTTVDAPCSSSEDDLDEHDTDRTESDTAMG